MAPDASRDDSAANPFAAPLTETTREDEAIDLDHGAETLRLKYRDEVRSIKNTGIFYMVAGVIGSLLVLVTIGDIVAVLQGTSDSTLAYEIVMAAIFVVAGPFQFWVGWKLRRLESGSRALAIALAVPGLLLIPIGTIAYSIVLYRLFRKDARYVLSAEYAQQSNTTR